MTRRQLLEGALPLVSLPAEQSDQTVDGRLFAGLLENAAGHVEAGAEGDAQADSPSQLPDAAAREKESAPRRSQKKAQHIGQAYLSLCARREADLGQEIFLRFLRHRFGKKSLAGCASEKTIELVGSRLPLDGEGADRNPGSQHAAHLRVVDFLPRGMSEKAKAETGMIGSSGAQEVRW